MDGREALDKLLHRLRQAVVGLPHIGVQRVAARLGELNQEERGDAGRLDLVRDVRVPREGVDALGVLVVEARRSLPVDQSCRSSALWGVCREKGKEENVPIDEMDLRVSLGVKRRRVDVKSAEVLQSERKVSNREMEESNEKDSPNPIACTNRVPARRTSGS